MKLPIDDNLISQMMNLRKEISKEKNWGFDLDEKEFIKGMLFLTPQSYGARIEGYIKNTISCTRNSTSNNTGDVCYKGKNIEIKASILTCTNDLLNLVQIRLFHDVDYYLCIAYDMRDIKKFQKHIFLLAHDDMVIEAKNARAAHGSKIANKKNANIELRLSVSCTDGDPVFERWKKNYLIEKFEDIENHV